MNLIHDERAYRQVLDDFVAGRVGASVFIADIGHLWKCDRTTLGVAAGSPQPADTPGFYGLMDAVNSLCEEYARSLPDGCGYRVSEEQFRHEIESLVAVKHGLASASAGHPIKAASPIG